MKIEINEERDIVLKEVYNSIVLQTNEGFEIAICMRDWGYDILIPKFDKHIHINDRAEIINLKG